MRAPATARRIRRTAAVPLLAAVLSALASISATAGAGSRDERPAVPRAPAKAAATRPAAPAPPPPASRPATRPEDATSSATTDGPDAEVRATKQAFLADHPGARLSTVAAVLPDDGFAAVASFATLDLRVGDRILLLVGPGKTLEGTVVAVKRGYLHVKYRFPTRNLRDPRTGDPAAYVPPAPPSLANPSTRPSSRPSRPADPPRPPPRAPAARTARGG